jgi:Rieske Fe-S protein
MMAAVDRRRFLSWGILGGAAGLGLGVGGRLVVPPRARDLSRLVPLGPASALPRGGSRHLPVPNVYVIHGQQGLCAISGRCTHLGCALLLRPEGFTCPCHGALFDLRGRPVSGPATRRLVWYRLRVSGGQLVLELGQRVPPESWVRG